MIESSLFKLVSYVEHEQLLGYDPYDALNSPILKSIGKDSKWLSICFTQILRNIPFNLRPILGISKGYNPKGMGLFLSSFVYLYKLFKKDKFLNNAKFCIDWLVENYCRGYSGYCWGYNFDWQNRSFFIPKGTPTIVNSSFIGHAFLDAFKLLGKQEYLDIARSTCNFIMYDLNIYEDDGAICFSYTPLDRSLVYNANYLGASLLIRAYSFTKEPKLLEYSKKAYTFSNLAQRDDGSWVYGAAKFQNWIDSFHTGFNLFALYIYEKSLGTGEFENYIRKGIKFYIDNFFLEDGTPKYYHDAVYPIDIHCSAVAIITLNLLERYDDRSIPLMQKVLKWTIKNMQDIKGYFYFRKLRFIKNRISYMRWGQAWMLYGLTNALMKYKEVI